MSCTIYGYAILAKHSGDAGRKTVSVCAYKNCETANRLEVSM